MIASRLDEIVRDYTAQLGDVREELGRERERREQLQRERDELRRELEALREARETSEKTPVSDASAHPDKLPPHAPVGAQEPTESPQTGESAERRSWWRRMFGG